MTGIRLVANERQFNHEMLSLARKVQGLTQTDLHQKTGISQAHLSKIEQGIQLPTDEHLEQLSSALGFPVNFFFQNNRCLPPITPFHRKRTALGKKSQEQAEAIANLKRIHLEKLLTEFEAERMIPKLELDEFGTPEKIAQVVRSYFMLPRGPIDNLVALLENYGVFIFLENFSSMQLAGFTLIGDGTTPIMFINKNAPGDMERLTIGHELGHLIMHIIITENVENEAWKFATEFLMPKADIIPDLRKARRIVDYADLKRKWKISMAALIRRAHELKIITDTQYRYLMQGMASYRVKEPVQTSQEIPTLFDELMSKYKNEYTYSPGELTQILNIHKAMFDDLYTKNTNGIKIVK
ncbi:MAG: XRE family transcriptional regulator [Treponema sp.]|jgi:Zn-dependent peptidase ImmA (M78 family)/DNA-binding XRE family transcriptional regulator|nr:XRE family transcriptional regulator [Treponema sp.]